MAQPHARIVRDSGQLSIRFRINDVTSVPGRPR